jgi:hypothetical protein
MTPHWLFLYVPTLRPGAVSSKTAAGCVCLGRRNYTSEVRRLSPERLVGRYFGIEILEECKLLSVMKQQWIFEIADGTG